MFPTTGEEKENHTKVGFHGSIQSDTQVTADTASEVVHFPAQPNTPSGLVLVQQRSACSCLSVPVKQTLNPTWIKNMHPAKIMKAI